jgi:hypothetical protein
VESQVVFHVAATPIKVGQAIRPYAISPEALARVGLTRELLSAEQIAHRRLIDAALRSNELLAGVYGGSMILLEAVFEQARLRTAPALPSRLGAIFAWSTPDLAKWYRTTYRPGGTIHRCTMVSGQSVERDGALIVEAFEVAGLANPAPGDLRLVEEQALRYWHGQALFDFPELIIHGTVVVEAYIDPREVHRQICR